jgi:hypothetical protein
MMKNQSIQIILGLAREKAVNHILGVLDYDNFLCQRVKLHTDFSMGSIFTVLPPNTNIDNIVDFSWGYGKKHDKFLPSRILKTLKSNTSYFAVFDDVMGELENGEISGSCLVNGDEVYHWICEEKATESKLNNLIMETGVSWHFLCVVFELDKNIDIKDCILLSKYNVFRNIVEVVVGAFDGEGYIHWIPNP